MQWFAPVSRPSEPPSNPRSAGNRSLARLVSLLPDWKTALAAVAIAVSAVAASAQPQDDPTAQAARISLLSGGVSVQPAGFDQWGEAAPNLTLGPGDRVYTDASGRAEIQVGQSFVRIGPNTDLTFVNATEQEIVFALGQGQAHLRTFALWPSQTITLETPNAAIAADRPGDLRADVFADRQNTIFTAFSDHLVVSGAGGFYQPLERTQSLELFGVNPLYPRWLQPAYPDALDQWSRQRDRQIDDARSYLYVSRDIPGAADLDAYGDWMPASEYGPVWFPRNLPPDWAPYHYGHWINREPWGWVWVGDEPWGYAPYHYGRWVNYRGRWGWIPGPREVRPVWSPALVVFAGGDHLGLSIWIPLGPGEPYRPWYRCSPRYIDRINITNIHEGPRVRVQRTYVNVTNITYINRDHGASALRHDDFASGRPVGRAGVRLDPHEMDRVRPIDRPEPRPNQNSFIGRPIGRPAPVGVQRPEVINRRGEQMIARPDAHPQQPPQSHQPIRPQQPPQGRTVAPPPANAAPQQPAHRGDNQPERIAPQDSRPQNQPQQNQPYSRPGQSQQPGAGQQNQPYNRPEQNQRQNAAPQPSEQRSQPTQNQPINRPGQIQQPSAVQQPSGRQNQPTQNQPFSRPGQPQQPTGVQQPAGQQNQPGQNQKIIRPEQQSQQPQSGGSKPSPASQPGGFHQGAGQPAQNQQAAPNRQPAPSNQPAAKPSDKKDDHGGDKDKNKDSDKDKHDHR
jgi:hypothetical protein